MFTYTPYGVSMVRNATNHIIERKEPSPKEYTATLHDEYMGLMKFMPRPATDDKMQIRPWRRSLIASIMGSTAFLHVRMLPLMMKSYN